MKQRARDVGRSGATWRSLAELSPVVRSLAREQFDNLVKRVRIFAPAETVAAIAELPGGVADDLLAAVASAPRSGAG